MNKHIVRTLVFILFATLFLGVGAAFAQSTVDWWVIANGGGISSGGNAVVNMTFGQPFTGPSNEGDTTLGAGYWGGIEADQPTVVALRNFAVRVNAQPWGTALVAAMLVILIAYNRTLRTRKK